MHMCVYMYIFDNSMHMKILGPQSRLIIEKYQKILNALNAATNTSKNTQLLAVIRSKNLTQNSIKNYLG